MSASHAETMLICSFRVSARILDFLLIHTGGRTAGGRASGWEDQRRYPYTPEFVLVFCFISHRDGMDGNNDADDELHEQQIVGYENEKDTICYDNDRERVAGPI